jgi:hypothetical protein
MLHSKRFFFYAFSLIAQSLFLWINDTAKRGGGQRETRIQDSGFRIQEPYIQAAGVMNGEHEYVVGISALYS